VEAFVLVATGSDGILEVDGEKVTITRKGVMGKLQSASGNGDETFELKNVAGIGFKRYSLSGKGHIQFGLVEADGTAHWSDSFLGNVSHDKHTVVFGMSAQKDFEAIRDYCLPLIGGEAALRGGGHNGETTLSKSDQLSRLVELKELGILSEQEFAREKSKIDEA